MMDWLNKHKEKHLKKGNTMYGYNIPNPKGATGTLSARYYKDGAEILIEDFIYKPKKISKTKNNYQHERVYKPIVSTSLNSGGGGWGANTGLYQTSKTDVRRLTPIECERLQGFPDGYTEGVSDTQRYKTLGNAVTVNVVTSLINKMFKGSEYDRTRK
jgi:site-specific DNA-cytosine methylase